jgi:nitrite reductase/ring-hydroxylating ferredoxin subunit
MHKACPLSELAPGEALRLNTAPPIAVFHTEDGELFAIDDTCTHQDASLTDGWVEDCEVECPLHASKFNLRTGTGRCTAGQTPPSAPTKSPSWTATSWSSSPMRRPTFPQD